MQNFLRQGPSPLQHPKAYTYIHLDKKGPEIWHFQLTNRRIFLRKGSAAPLQPPNHIHFQI